MAEKGRENIYVSGETKNRIDRRTAQLKYYYAPWPWATGERESE